MSDPIVLSDDPEVLEYPFNRLDGLITPNGRFYVRNHFAVPEIDSDSWRLKVEGAVDKPLELTLDDIKSMPTRTLTSTLECAGNNRIFLTPPVKGVKWELGGASTAAWTGISLADLLNLAGVQATAAEVILEGADCGEVKEEPKPPGPIHFARSLPIAKAMEKDVLLIYQMNGEQLSAKHGFPLRAIVAGWYAMASVKWLSRIIVSETSFGGYFQTTDYAFWQRQDGHPVRVPISRMLVKAEIAYPLPNQTVERNCRLTINGAAWAGERLVAKVEISQDGGASWSPAKLVGEPVRYAWQLWEYAWLTPSAPGKITLLARATDETGETQPLEHDPDRENYMFNFCLPVRLEVR
jgi:DMSO/TMAO reductase YedYZ molybdopterin-dependent catalytic subunit